MEGSIDLRNRIFTISDCSAEEALIIFSGLAGDDPQTINLLQQVLKITGDIMALVKIEQGQLDAVNAKLADVVASENRQEERLNTLLSAQDTTIADLRAQIVALQEADNGIPAATLQPILDGLDGLIAQQDAFKSSAPPPPPPPIVPDAG